MNTTRVPVVFIHGLWLHASSWEPWLDLFTQAGYAPIAPGWPGVPATVELARANPASIAGHGIDDVTAHYAGIIAELPTLPVIIGHSFGGMIAEKLLGEDLGAAAIAIDAEQINRDSTAVTDLAEFADRGHSLTIDSGWRAVADECLSWLNKQGF
jgi:pimeloyl-ACP methyl ester carboxylesterase